MSNEILNLLKTLSRDVERLKTFDVPRSTADGWTPTVETWTYVSATSFTVPGDETVRFGKGTRIKCTQTTVKYFYVVSSSYNVGTGLTTVTITGGSDYPLANAAITEPYYSYQSIPQNFPDWFNWNPSPVGWSSLPAQSIYRFRVEGRRVICVFRQGGASTSNSTAMTFTAPITAATITNMFWGECLWSVVDNSAGVATPGRMYISSGSATITCNKDINAATWTASGTKLISGNLGYEF